MKNDTFIDTSGFYALLVKRDSMHGKAKDILRKAANENVLFVTTDYILDETATLLHARGHANILSDMFDVVLESRACNIEWMDQDRFLKSRSLFLKYADHSWSFTDCFSFMIMKELRLTKALTKDGHFREAGFVPLLI